MLNSIPFLPRFSLLAAFCACVQIGIASPLIAQEGEDGITRFAPGATGEITQDLVEMMRRARDDADALKQSLKVQGPSARPNFDAGAARDAALKNPKILELLGVDGEKEAEIARSEGHGDAWTETQGFLFASFSLPPQALRDLMLGAEEMGLPVLFRGFHKNSVFETNDALLEVFGDPEDIKGFSIDPTLFAQFDVKAVPTLVILKDPYSMCETQACEGDAAPVHDRLAGTITVRSALELIERGDGDASLVARQLLEGAEQ